jgi:hypothetical protein
MSIFLQIVIRGFVFFYFRIAPTFEKNNNSEEANGGHNNISDMMIITATLKQQEKESYPKENQAITKEPFVAQKGLLDLLTLNSSRATKDAHEKLNTIVDNHNSSFCSSMDFNY